MATVTVSLSPSYSTPQKASGFALAVVEKQTKVTFELTFEEGLKLLRDLTGEAKKYRDAIQADLDVTARLASMAPPPHGDDEPEER